MFKCSVLRQTDLRGFYYSKYQEIIGAKSMVTQFYHQLLKVFKFHTIYV